MCVVFVPPCGRPGLHERFFSSRNDPQNVTHLKEITFEIIVCQGRLYFPFRTLCLETILPSPSNFKHLEVFFLPSMQTAVIPCHAPKNIESTIHKSTVTQLYLPAIDLFRGPVVSQSYRTEGWINAITRKTCSRYRLAVKRYSMFYAHRQQWMMFLYLRRPYDFN